MSSRLERALNLLSSDKTSLSLKRDAADRITEVLLQSEDSVPSILEQICTQLLDSRNNNCRICCASVLKSFSEKYKTNFFFSLENSQFLISTGSTFERCSVFDEPSLFVDTYEELQSKETTVYDSLVSKQFLLRSFTIILIMFSKYKLCFSAATSEVWKDLCLCVI